MSRFATEKFRWKTLGEAPLPYALAGSLLLFMALPPLQWSALGFLAPIPWVLLVRAPREVSRKKMYLRLWIAGVVFWLGAVHWLRLPHWATSFGWIALSLYLGCYLPLFVALSRVAVHRYRISSVLAAPVVWAGLELARAHLITGFLMAALGHTQVNWLEFIQIADLAGSYAVSFAVMLVAACLARVLPISGERIAVWPVVPLAAAVAAILWYGDFRLQQSSDRKGPYVALVQGSIDADWKQDPGKDARINATYLEISQRAVAAAPRPLDVIVWPETMYRRPLLVLDSQLQLGDDAPFTRSDLERAAQDFHQEVAGMSRLLETPLILGVETMHFEGPEAPPRFNSSIAVLRDGTLSQRYDKNHLVLFGEYVPLSKLIPGIENLSPIGSGLEAGSSASSFLIGETRYAPNVCYESVLPHVIAAQIHELQSRDEDPDVLVNLTNDAWFWGSSELDMHLACDVFRAVECRRPMLVAANGGLTAAIDSSGRVLQQLPRRTEGFLLVDVPLDARESIYLKLGDWPAALALLACALLGLGGFLPLFRDGKSTENQAKIENEH